MHCIPWSAGTILSDATELVLTLTPNMDVGSRFEELKTNELGASDNIFEPT